MKPRPATTPIAVPAPSTGIAARILHRIGLTTPARHRVMHRSTWSTSDEFRLVEAAAEQRGRTAIRPSAADAHRRAIAAFRAAHGRAPRVDSRYPSERRLALWSRAESASAQQPVRLSFVNHSN